MLLLPRFRKDHRLFDAVIEAAYVQGSMSAARVLSSNQDKHRLVAMAIGPGLRRHGVCAGNAMAAGQKEPRESKCREIMISEV